MIYGQCTELQNRMNMIICSLPNINWMMIINVYDECQVPVPSELAQLINSMDIEDWCIGKYVLYLRMRDYLRMRNVYKLFFDMKKLPTKNIINVFLSNNVLISKEDEYLKEFFQAFESYYKAMEYYPSVKFLEIYFKDIICHKCTIAIIAVARLYSYHKMIPSVNNMVYLCSLFKADADVLKNFFSLIPASSFDIERVKSICLTPNVSQLKCLSLTIKEYFGIDIEQTWFPFQNDVLYIVRKRKINEVF